VGVVVDQDSVQELAAQGADDSLADRVRFRCPGRTSQPVKGAID
jgi:hypothetical protein